MDRVNKSFTLMCKKCGSYNCEVGHDFNYYGGYTGYDFSVWVECLDCKEKADVY